MRSQRARTVIEWVAVAILATLLSALVVGTHVARQPRLSYIDEYLYVDAVAKVPTQLFVHRGEELGEVAREALECRGIILFGAPAGSACGDPAPLADEAFPLAGMTSADIYPPLYAAITWVGAEAIAFVAGIEDPVTAMRLAGALWLAPALALLYAACRVSDVRRPAAAGVMLVAAGSMPVLHAHTFVSTDSSSLLAGAAMTLLAMRILRGQGGYGVLVAAAVFFTLLKLQNFGAVLIAVIAIAIGSVVTARREPGSSRSSALSVLLSRRGAALAMALALPLLAQGGWLLIRSAIAVGEAPEQGIAVPMTLAGLLREATALFYNAAGGAIPASQIGLDAVSLAGFVGVVTTAGPFAAMVLGSRHSAVAALGAATVIAFVSVGPALAMATWLSTGEYFTLPSRYGMPLLPAALVCFAAALGGRSWTAWLLVALGAGAVALSCLSVTIN